METQPVEQFDAPEVEEKPKKKATPKTPTVDSSTERARAVVRAKLSAR